MASTGSPLVQALEEVAVAELRAHEGQQARQALHRPFLVQLELPARRALRSPAQQGRRARQVLQARQVQSALLVQRARRALQLQDLSDHQSPDRPVLQVPIPSFLDLLARKVQLAQQDRPVPTQLLLVRQARRAMQVQRARQVLTRLFPVLQVLKVWLARRVPLDLLVRHQT